MSTRDLAATEKSSGATSCVGNPSTILPYNGGKTRGVHLSEKRLLENQRFSADFKVDNLEVVDLCRFVIMRVVVVSDQGHRPVMLSSYLLAANLVFGSVRLRRVELTGVRSCEISALSSIWSAGAAHAERLTPSLSSQFSL